MNHRIAGVLFSDQPIWGWANTSGNIGTVREHPHKNLGVQFQLQVTMVGFFNVEMYPMGNHK